MQTVRLLYLIILLIEGILIFVCLEFLFIYIYLAFSIYGAYVIWKIIWVLPEDWSFVHHSVAPSSRTYCPGDAQVRLKKNTRGTDGSGTNVWYGFTWYGRRSHLKPYDLLAVKLFILNSLKVILGIWAFHLSDDPNRSNPAAGKILRHPWFVMGSLWVKSLELIWIDGRHHIMSVFHGKY